VEPIPFLHYLLLFEKEINLKCFFDDKSIQLYKQFQHAIAYVSLKPQKKKRSAKFPIARQRKGNFADQEQNRKIEEKVCKISHS
jgi:hypothetical protein